MTELQTAVARPGRIQTELTAHYWEAAAGGILTIQRCADCGVHQFYPRRFCASCWSDEVAWVEASGGGTVWTFTVAHKPGHPAWAADVPYVIAVIELDEGPRFLTNILTDDPTAVAVGRRVQLDRDSRPLAFRLS